MGLCRTCARGEVAQALLLEGSDSWWDSSCPLPCLPLLRVVAVSSSCRALALVKLSECHTECHAAGTVCVSPQPHLTLVLGAVVASGIHQAQALPRGMLQRTQQAVFCAFRSLAPRAEPFLQSPGSLLQAKLMESSLECWTSNAPWLLSSSFLLAEAATFGSGSLCPPFPSVSLLAL